MLLNSRLKQIGELKQQVEQQPLVLQTITTAASKQQNIQWQMLRLDTIDEELSGNKLFKLLPYLEKAAAAQCSTLLSFGGRYSNHLHALAHACKRYGFHCVAMVRGYEEQGLTATLQDLYQLGAEVHFLSRQDYRRRYELEFQQQLMQAYGNALLIEEGGNGKLGRQGMQLLAQLLSSHLLDADYLVLPSGTGCCLLGLLDYLPPQLSTKLLAVLAVNNKAELQQAVANYDSNKVELIDGYQFGGFGKTPKELLAFIDQFKQQQQIALDPVYTGKMCWAVEDLIRQGYFRANSRIVCLHTGGLQGARSLTL